MITCMKKVFALLLIALLFVACEKKYPDPSGSPPLVIVSIAPYEQIVERIAGKTVIVESAVPENYDPHIYEITPKRLNLLSSASLWIGVHEPFEHKIVPLIQSLTQNFRYLDLTTRVPLLKFAKDTKPLLPEEHDHHHGDQKCCGKEGFDRHIWMSPKLMITQAKAIRDALIDLLPEFTAKYNENYTRLANELADLNATSTATLMPYNGSGIIVNHASLGYFCDDFNLKQFALETEGKALLPHQLEELETAVKTYNIGCIFILPQFDDRGAQQIAKALKLKTEKIDPLKRDYLSNIKQIVQQIVECKEDNAPTY